MKDQLKRYILDLTKAKLPAAWPKNTPLKIEVREGCHVKDFDVTPEEMLKQWAIEHVTIVNQRRIDAGLMPITNDFPLGFDRDEIPKGAKLVEQS